MEFSVGQRWVSHTETDLGLGIITEIDGRLVSISFPAAAEQRTYAADNAPLSRIEFKPGDAITTNDERTFVVDEVIPAAGRLIYQCHDADNKSSRIDELDLNSFIELATPKQRLTSGQLDDLKAYQLRCETLEHLDRLQQSPARGLLGTRTSFLPHQVYIAHEVAQRFAPRVLLADEVGLGKTIEAGMILHYQLQTGMASRVLVIVPATLVHQWLVEMLRRFNLRFALFNEERLKGLSATDSNPFETEQLVICSQDILTGQPDVLAQALAADWDMVVVDEAHHLHWQAEAADAGEPDLTYHDYACIEALARKSRGLLLLTATPEQVGAESHFARLRLLDPARFHSFADFMREEQGYHALNETMRELLGGSGKLSVSMQQQLAAYLGDEAPKSDVVSASEIDALVASLLDRHGTGRVFLRNTRAAIKGFPERRLVDYPLAPPRLYEGLVGATALYPELAIEESQWLTQDPRVTCLIDLLNKLKPEKVLVICANASTATALEQYLHLRIGIRSAAFYEGLSIIERDRAAAYFADSEMGAQVLVCSEIGSEGRNFQFAHHLVLFDLPLNPDLLEQRIGRLDRIGQTEVVNVHVPYLEVSAQQVLFDWYHRGLNLFAESCAAAYAIYETFEGRLDAALQDPAADHSRLVADTAAHTRAVKQAMEEGRDRLIELNSCDRGVAQQVIESIQAEENPALLADYLGRLLDTYGVDHEDHSANAWVLHPTDHMRSSYFPGLGDESTTVCFDRDTALVREDMEFVSWEHPMLSEAMGMILHSEVGNATVATLKLPGVQPGTLLLEAFFSIACVAPRHLQVDRYLPLSPFRALVNIGGKDLSSILSTPKLNELCRRVKRQTAQNIVKQVRNDIERLVGHAQALSEQALPGLLDSARQRAQRLLGAEISRLRQLQARNASIRSEEIEHLEQQLRACESAITDARFELQALRLVVATP